MCYILRQLFCLTLLCLSVTAHGQIIFDSTFHADGRLSYQYNLGTTEAYSHTVLSDGSILAAGNEPASYYAGYLVRFQPDGSNSGASTVSNCMDRMVIHRMPNDTLIIAGQGWDNTFNHQPANQMITVVKLLPNGQPAPAFGSGGKISFYVPLGMAWNGGHPSAVTTQPDGKVVVSITVNTFFPYSMVVRLLPNGQFDPTFGQGGVTEILLGNCGYIINRIFPVAGNKLLFTGDYKTAGSTQHYSAFRLQPDGTYDSTYGTDGYVYTMVGFDGHVYGSAIQPDGRVVLVGNASVGYSMQSAAIRYTADGLVDNTFGTAGIFYSAFGNNGYHYAAAVERDSQGRFYMLGTYSPNGGQGWNWYLARLKADGTPDSSFNNNAPMFNFGIYSDANRIRGLSLLPDGKILTYGDYRDGNYNWNLFLGRLLTKPWVAIGSSGAAAYCAGDTATLVCHWAGPRQWYRSGTLLPDTSKAIRVTQSGSYIAIGPNGSSTDTSNAVVLTFHPHPQPIIQIVGDSLVASGSGTFRWFRADSTMIAGANGKIFRPGTGGGYFVQLTDGNGCTGYSPTVFFTPAGISTAQTASGTLHCWPNPVADRLYIRNDGQERYTLELTLITGQVLARYAVAPGDKVIDLSRLSPPSGTVLFLQFTNGQERLVQRVLVR